MPKKSKHLQLRRCGLCTKVGHNKSTCPEAVTQQRPPATPHDNQVHFFVHHVTTEPPASPHIVNLKKNTASLWDRVEVSSPKKSTNPAYHYHHQKHTEIPPASRVEVLKLEAIATGAKRILKFPPAAPAEYLHREAPARGEAAKSLPKSVVLPAVKNRAAVSVKKIKTQKPSLPLRTRLRNWQTAYDQKIIALSQTLENSAAHFVGNARSVLLNGPSKRATAFALLVITLIGIVPLPARSYYVELQKNKVAVVENSTAGFKALENSTRQLLASNLSDATDSTEAALSHFDTAITTLEKYQWLETIVSAIPVVKDQIASRQKLLIAGQQITVGNSYLLASVTTAETASTTPLSKINHVLQGLKPALPNYQQAVENLNDVDPAVLPAEYQDAFTKFRTLFAATVNDLTSISSLEEPINEIFGGEGLRRYLIAFQNPAELRPTGGFVGSFAIIEVKDGKIIKFDIPAGGSYDLQGQLDQYVEPPTPLLLTNKRWEFQDANWFPDFSASSQKMLWFYRHSRGITLDGVIAVNAPVLEKILALVGPVTDEQRGLTLTTDNALTTLQQVVEEGPEKKLNKPKQILGDLAHTLIGQLGNLNSATTLSLLKNIQESLQEKDIQAYFTDAATEASVASFGWAGTMTPTRDGQDYLMVVNTNIQGQKSDAEIKQSITHQAVVDADGSIVDTVIITRTHQGDATQKLYGAPNTDYIRVYVPEGSTLLSAAGFTWPDDTSFRAPENWYKKDGFLTEQEKLVTIDPASGTHVINEFGKTSFGNWIITTAGQTNQVQFTYRLPFKVTTQSAADNRTFLAKLLSPKAPTGDYSLVAQRQSGSVSSFNSQIIFPNDWNPIWKNSDEITLATNGAEISVPNFTKDSIWSIILNKNH